MQKEYTQGFKARMVKRMAGAEAISASALSREVGVSQSTLSRWLRSAGTVMPMGGSQNKQGGAAKRPRDWPPEKKLRAVVEASGLAEGELGEYLRKKGLHTAELEEWRAIAVQALRSAKKVRRTKSPEAKRIRVLEKEVHRKDKALAEVTALLALKKKLEAIWGDEDDRTRMTSET